MAEWMAEVDGAACAAYFPLNASSPVRARLPARCP
jgi:hypothetical protein